MKEQVVHYANEALNKFGLTSDEIALHIKGLINRSYHNKYGHCDCVIVDQTVPDDTLVELLSKRSSQNAYTYLYNYCHAYYLCFALKGLKIGLHWNGKPY